MTHIDSWSLFTLDHNVERLEDLNWNDYQQLLSLFDSRPACAARITHTKAGFAYSQSDEQLLEWWRANRSAAFKARVFIKPDETAALRLIVLTDQVSYIKSAYVNQDFDLAQSDIPELWTFKAT